jgi:hypothetical protein
MVYCTNTLVKTYLGVSGSGDDTLITTLIARAQAAIDRHTNRTFEAAADTTRKFTVGDDTDGLDLYLDEDLCAITTVTTDADGDADALTVNVDYVTVPRNTTPYYALKILGGSSYSWTYTDEPENGITVLGRWAWSTAAPDDIVHACVRLAAYYYQQKDAQVFDTVAVPDAGVITIPQGIPADVKLILAPYRKYA